MMEYYSNAMLLSILLFTISASFTPGPNNIMLLSSGVTFGFKRTLPHMLGVTLGYPVMLIILGFGLDTIFKAYPIVLKTLSILGISYLLWMAYKIATNVSADTDINVKAKPFTFIQAALFQWLNPKAWIMTITAMGIFITSSENSIYQLCIMAFISMVVTIISTSLWAMGGVFLRKILQNDRHMSIFNKTMAVLLVVSVVPFVLE